MRRAPPGYAIPIVEVAQDPVHLNFKRAGCFTIPSPEMDIVRK